MKGVLVIKGGPIGDLWKKKFFALKRQYLCWWRDEVPFNHDAQLAFTDGETHQGRLLLKDYSVKVAKKYETANRRVGPKGQKGFSLARVSDGQDEYFLSDLDGKERDQWVDAILWVEQIEEKELTAVICISSQVPAKKDIIQLPGTFPVLPCKVSVVKGNSMTLDDSELPTAKDEPLTLLEVLEGGKEGIAENSKKQKGKIHLRWDEVKKGAFWPQVERVTLNRNQRKEVAKRRGQEAFDVKQMTIRSRFQRALEEAAEASASTKTFGEKLAVVCKRGGGLPLPMQDCINELIKKRSLHTEGLFRIPGSADYITKIKADYDKGVPVNLSGEDPHTVAGILKFFLKELPEPIVPPVLDKEVRGILMSSRDASPQEITRQIAKHLPLITQALVGLFRKVADNAEKNLMTAENIITCMVPALECVPAILYYPLLHYDQFFRDFFKKDENAPPGGEEMPPPPESPPPSPKAMPRSEEDQAAKIREQFEKQVFKGTCPNCGKRFGYLATVGHKLKVRCPACRESHVYDPQTPAHKKVPEKKSSAEAPKEAAAAKSKAQAEAKAREEAARAEEKAREEEAAARVAAAVAAAERQANEEEARREEERRRKIEDEEFRLAAEEEARMFAAQEAQRHAEEAKRAAAAAAKKSSSSSSSSSSSASSSSSSSSSSSEDGPTHAEEEAQEAAAQAVDEAFAKELDAVVETSTYTQVSKRKIFWGKEVTDAYNEVRAARAGSADWALFGYHPQHDQNLVLVGKGSGGVRELQALLDESKALYGFVRVTVGDSASGGRFKALPKFASITFVGERLPVMKRARVSGDKPMIKALIADFSIELAATKAQEVSAEDIESRIMKVLGLT